MKSTLKSIFSPEYKKIVERLKAAREKSGLSQVEVALALKKPQSYVSKIESGQRRIDILELKEVAKLYKKSIQYFLK